MKISRRLQLHALAVVALVVAAMLILDSHSTWRGLLVPAIVAGIAGLALATIIARTITRPLDDLRDIARFLARGDLSSRPALSASGEVGELATAVHRLAEHLGERMSALQSEDALLTALVESLNEGVVAISPQRQAVRINSAGRELLSFNDRTPAPVDRLPRIPELQQAIHVALEGTPTEPVELAIGERTVSLTARPLAGGGAVLALFDLTRIRRLELVRRDFVANVSHELRTPLTVIGGFAETLADDDLPEKSRRQFAATIHANAQRMQRIVDDLLDLSRLESGRWTPEVTTVDVRSVAEEVFATVQKPAEEKNLSLEIDIGEGANTVVADRTALRQVISNLAENAVRYTASGSVTVFTERDAGGTWIGVRDTGPGITREHLPRIFERFYRVDAGRARDGGGTGLGLAIVKHLVEAHGGVLKAESKPGEGTWIAALFPTASA
jgi:two-component system, OmpR family, phosphate regulon sensor histidine kinase PhoR